MRKAGGDLRGQRGGQTRAADDPAQRTHHAERIAQAAHVGHPHPQSGAFQRFHVLGAVFLAVGHHQIGFQRADARDVRVLGAADAGACRARVFGPLAELGDPDHRVAKPQIEQQLGLRRHQRHDAPGRQVGQTQRTAERVAQAGGAHGQGLL